MQAARLLPCVVVLLLMVLLDSSSGFPTHSQCAAARATNAVCLVWEAGGSRSSTGGQQARAESSIIRTPRVATDPPARASAGGTSKPHAAVAQQQLAPPTTAHAQPFEGKVDDSRPTRVILSVPGSSFSYRFMQCWSNALLTLAASDRYDVSVTLGSNSLVTLARLETMQIDIRLGPKQQLFRGVPFDVWVTLDSDIIFTPQQLLQLINSTRDHDVVSGLYPMASGNHYVASPKMNLGQKTAKISSLIPVPDLEQWQEQHPDEKYLDVDYVGLGFFAITRKALESVKFPYFWRSIRRYAPTIDDPELAGTLVVADISSEDVNFCRNLREAGFEVYVNTELVVGHEKLLVVEAERLSE